MRILVLALAGGGIGRYGALFASALAEHPGVQIRVLADASLSASGIFGPMLEKLPNRFLAIRTRKQRLSALFALHQETRQFQPDVIHDTSGTSGPLAPLPWLLPAGKTRMVVTEHDVMPHSGMGNALVKRLARRVVRTRPDMVLVHGEAAAREFRSGRHKVGLVKVIPHGEMGIYGRHSSDVERDPKRVLFFGALRPNKGIDLMPEIAELVLREVPDARFIIVGSSRVSRELMKSGWGTRIQSLLGELRAHPAFEVKEGFMPDEEVGDLFHSAAVTLLPYRDATASGVAMIALPLGSAIVATRVGDLPRQLHQGRTGMLVDSCPESIANAVIRLLKDEALRSRLTARGREYALDALSWKGIAEHVVAGYRDLMTREPG